MTPTKPNQVKPSHFLLYHANQVIIKFYLSSSSQTISFQVVKVP